MHHSDPALTSDPQFRLLAKKYVWWKSLDEALRYPRQVIAQIMNLGTWTDVRRLETLVGRTDLRDVIEHADPGWFSPDSWCYWHYRLGLTPPARAVPAMPVRTLA